MVAIQKELEGKEWGEENQVNIVHIYKNLKMLLGYVRFTSYFHSTIFKKSFEQQLYSCNKNYDMLWMQSK